MAFSPVDCSWINASGGVPSYTDVELRRLDAVLVAGAGDTSDPLKVRGGIARHASNSLAVTVDVSDVVTLQAGGVVIPGDDTAGNGAYRAALAASQTQTLSARHASWSRIDLVVFEVIVGGTQAQPRIIAGTPAASPTAPAKPTRAVELARITVPPTGGGAASVDSSLRTFAAAAGGVIPCTSATRPGHVEGQLIYEMDTDKLLVSDGTRWTVVGGNSDPVVSRLVGTPTTNNATTPGSATRTHDMNFAIPNDPEIKVAEFRLDLRFDAAANAAATCVLLAGPSNVIIDQVRIHNHADSAGWDLQGFASGKLYVTPAMLGTSINLHVDTTPDAGGASLGTTGQTYARCDLLRGI